MSLYPTKTRLALLQAIKDHQVYRVTWGTIEYRWFDRRVTARCLEFMRAGWVTFEDPTTLGDLRLYLALTEDGCRVLDGAS